MKCKCCGCVLSYDDKKCTICGAPPEQDYEHNKDRTVTTLLDILKGAFVNNSSPIKKNNSSVDFNNPPQQYCIGCGKPMIMEKGIDGYNHDGTPINCYHCYCPETKKPFLSKMFSNESHYRWRLILKNRGWDTVSYAEDY